MRTGFVRGAAVAEQPKLRLTRRTRRVLAVLLTDAANLSAFTLCQCAGIGVGPVFLLLIRLEKAGLVVGEWENDADGRPRRRFYRLTPDGWVWAWDVLGLTRPEVRRG